MNNKRIIFKANPMIREYETMGDVRKMLADINADGSIDIHVSKVNKSKTKLLTSIQKGKTTIRVTDFMIDGFKYYTETATNWASGREETNHYFKLIGKQNRASYRLFVKKLVEKFEEDFNIKIDHVNIYSNFFEIDKE